MDLNSPLFDCIRVHPRDEGPQPSQSPDRCEHRGCDALGEFRAPKGRGREGQFWRFCLEHVRAYNQTYNYFAGMPEEDVVAYQRDASTGHRPTWTMGVNPGGRRGGEAGRTAFEDPLDVFGAGAGFRRAPRPPEPEGRSLRIQERKALEALDLEMSASPAAITARYKTLVKRLHPDANGGDRSSEDKLRRIIESYKTLKRAGVC